MNAQHIASALSKCDLSGVSIGDKAIIRQAIEALSREQPDLTSEPVPMLLYCPNCGTQHIDAPEEREIDKGSYIDIACNWTNPPHRSHLCHACETTWRPADIATTGVAAIQTRGKSDTWAATAIAAPASYDMPGLRAAIESMKHDETDVDHPIHPERKQGWIAALDTLLTDVLPSFEHSGEDAPMPPSMEGVGADDGVRAAYRGSVNLEGLREKLLAPREIKRDKYGWLVHPDFPVCDEGVLSDAFLAAFGMESAFVPMDGADADTYSEAGEPDCSFWTPEPPEGKGWVLLEISDTEDGVYAMYAREKKPETNRERRERERLAITAPPFQMRVLPWLLDCFGAKIARNKGERNHRFLEESLELVQSLGCTAHEAHQLVDYVFNRSVGVPVQEVGGVMVTLAALCLAHEMDMHAAGEIELARVSVPEIVLKIRAKQAAKPKHSPLPMVVAEAAEVQPSLYFHGDHERGFQCPDDSTIVSGRELGERYFLRAAWYFDVLFEVTKVPDETDDGYAVRKLSGFHPSKGIAPIPVLGSRP